MSYRGHYSDGKSAARREVVVALMPTHLEIRDEAQPWSVLWSYGDLALIDMEGQAGGTRLTRRSDPAPRLSVPDPAFLRELLTRSPVLDPKAQRRRRTAAIVLASVVCVPILFAILWFVLPQLAKPAAALIPESVEQRIGEKVAGLVIGGARICDAEAGTRALERLTDRLWSGLDRPVSFDVRVIEHPMVNAMAIPGGHVVVFSGLLHKAEAPEELAGVLAHEVGHVAHRHGMQALVRHFALSFVITAFTGNDWGLGSAAQLLIQFAHSREAESEADMTALAILDRAGIPPSGLAGFFARMEKAERNSDGFLRYMSTHPPTAERIAALEAASPRPAPQARNARAPEPALSAGDWASLKAICKSE